MISLIKILNEIKIISKKNFTFKGKIDIGGNTIQGELYFENNLLDDTAEYDEDEDIVYFRLVRHNYHYPDNLQNKLSKYINNFDSTITNKLEGKYILFDNNLKNDDDFEDDDWGINEIKIIPYRKLTANKSHTSTSSRSYTIKMDDNDKFTIHKHKTHVSLYPSFNPNSKKYKKIKEFLNSKGVPIQELSNEPSIVFFRINNPERYILFNDDKTN